MVPISGVVGPNQSVILFDPQAQSYVNHSGSAILTLTIFIGQSSQRHWILGWWLR